MKPLRARFPSFAVRRRAEPADNQPKLRLLPPLAAWLVGLAAFTALGVESLFSENHFVFLIARVTAYITAALMGALVPALLALFGLACGHMLLWLEDAANGRLVARSISTSVWVLTAYMWVGVLLLLASPPAPMTVQDVATDQLLQARLQGEPAFVWITQLRYWALGGFLTFCAWRLARHVQWPNAVIAVGFGAALIAAVLALLGALAGALPAVS